MVSTARAGSGVMIQYIALKPPPDFELNGHRLWRSTVRRKRPEFDRGQVCGAYIEGAVCTVCTVYMYGLATIPKRQILGIWPYTTYSVKTWDFYCHLTLRPLCSVWGNVEDHQWMTEFTRPRQQITKSKPKLSYQVLLIIFRQYVYTVAYSLK